MSLGRWWAQLRCPHAWAEKRTIDNDVRWVRWECWRCGKEMERRTGDPPRQPLRTRDAMSAEYHKIQTVFLRDPATKHRTLLEGQWAVPEFGYLAENEWVWTEKVDGTNVRVRWDGESVRFGGRSDDAQMPTFLIDVLQERFTPEAMRAVFPDGSATLYGEGYGVKIQKGGGNYLSDRCGFILFDVWCGMWLERANVADIAGKLGVPEVPVIGVGSLTLAIEAVKGGLPSLLTDKMLAEGLVMRPLVELATRRGDRIIAKVKGKDFKAP